MVFILLQPDIEGVFMVWIKAGKYGAGLPFAVNGETYDGPIYYTWPGFTNQLVLPISVLKSVLECDIIILSNRQPGNGDNRFLLRSVVGGDAPEVRHRPDQ